MPPKPTYLRNLQAANALAKANPPRPLPQASWEGISKPQFKKNVQFTDAKSVRSSSGRSTLFEGELTRHVRDTTQEEEDELQKRRDPLYNPRRLYSDTKWQYTQAVLRYKEAWGHAHPSTEARAQARALGKYSAQEASPVAGYQRFASNFFKQ